MNDFRKYVIGPMENPENTGLPIGLPTLQRVIGGIRQESLILIGSSSGVGKTALADKLYMLEPYDYFIKNRDKMDIDFHGINYSMERSKSFKLQKWTCYKLFKDYKIVCDVPTLNQWYNKRYILTDDLREKIKSLEAYFEEMMDYITIIDGPMNPTGIMKFVDNYANELAATDENGEKVNKIVRKVDARGFEYPEHLYKRKKEKENTIVTIIIDNLDILKTESSKEGGGKMGRKERIDKMIEYLQRFRDVYKFTCIPISQFNRSLGNVQRMKVKDVVEPEPDDFKNSANPYDAADIVFAPFNPVKLHIDRYLKYDLNKFRSLARGDNRFRGLVVLKNSYGPDDVSMGLNFLGEVGEFRELPHAGQITDYSVWANYESIKYPSWKYPGFKIEKP